MKRFATVLLFTTLLCGCPVEEKKDPAPAPAASEEGEEAAEEATDDEGKTPEEMAEDKENATKEGTDKANKAIGAVLGGGKK